VSGLEIDLSHAFGMTVFFFEPILYNVKSKMTVILSEAEGSPANPITATASAMAYN
jgi:hypothetical protein